MKKYILYYLVIIFIIFSCKSFSKFSNTGSFILINNSDKIVEFIWIAKEGEFYPTAKSINIKKNESYEIENLEQGTYDIAIDFKDEYNSFNSKKDKSLCLNIEKGIKKVWIIGKDGKIIRE